MARFLPGKNSSLPEHALGSDNGTMVGDTTHPVELGTFLKARRAELRPRDVGLPDGGGERRVPGLRREEVAALAAISVDYYTRLEQGRVAASASVLATLARTLRLNDDQRAYLASLAGKPLAAARRRSPVRPPMRRIIEQLTETPALVLGPRTDILAWNAMAAALYTDFARFPSAQRNYVRLLFVDPALRDLHTDWTAAARTAVAALRMEAARDPDDPHLALLVGELSVRDANFRAWWGGQLVSSASYGVKHYRHPVVGDLTLDCDTWSCPDGSDQRLMVLTAEPGTPSHQGLRILASWTAEPASPGAR
jgi:transcriptional regulator with XRE-family HTH domain